MNQAAYTNRAFEPIFTSQVPFFKRIIAKYFSADEQADVLQEFSIHFFLLYEKKYQVHAELFDSKAWLRTIVTHFCISLVRKKKAQKNAVWENTINTAILRAAESEVAREHELISLMSLALGCVTKQEALILKMKYMYQKSSKEIEQRLGLQYVDVQINRIKLKIRKKLATTDHSWL